MENTATIGVGKDEGTADTVGLMDKIVVGRIIGILVVGIVLGLWFGLVVRSRVGLMVVGLMVEPTIGLMVGRTI